MRWSWFGDFFGTLPDVAKALWDFGDPSSLGQGWWGLLIILIWGVFIIGLPLAIARKTYGEREWVSATMGAIAALGVIWWVFGILPSAFIYFVDSNKELLQGPVIPGSMAITIGDYRLDIASNLYDVIRDIIVVTMTGVGVVATVWAALKIQDRLPKTLAPGERKPESGGYK